MSLLPQRKKSPEEIARIRESLGIPAVPPDAPPPAPPPLRKPQPPPPAAPQTSRPADPAPTDSEEEVIVLPVAGNTAEKSATSFRKSDSTSTRQPSHTVRPVPGSKLPTHRHSDREIEELRHRQRLAELNAAPNPKLLPAHPAAIIPGYLPPVAAAVGFYFYNIHIAITAACLAASLVFAAVIFLRKPVSRHHAAFITAFTLLTTAFAFLHYFPHLRHAT